MPILIPLKGTKDTVLPFKILSIFWQTENWLWCDHDVVMMMVIIMVMKIILMSCWQYAATAATADEKLVADADKMLECRSYQSRMHRHHHNIVIQMMIMMMVIITLRITMVIMMSFEFHWNWQPLNRYDDNDDDYNENGNFKDNDDEIDDQNDHDFDDDDDDVDGDGGDEKLREIWWLGPHATSGRHSQTIHHLLLLLMITWLWSPV